MTNAYHIMVMHSPEELRIQQVILVVPRPRSCWGEKNEEEETEMKHETKARLAQQAPHLLQTRKFYMHPIHKFSQMRRYISSSRCRRGKRNSLRPRMSGSTVEEKSSPPGFSCPSCCDSQKSCLQTSCDSMAQLRNCHGMKPASRPRIGAPRPG